ncbi:MAG: hypothetical protein CK604_07190 [Curvibacter sp. PD_MW3]|nr:MAG: hypothetical protein CK604_07190 [Curvibacter sp. PD_MW3]
MVTWLRQHPVLAATFCVGVMLSVALPVDQFIELAKLTILGGLTLAGACLVLLVSPGLLDEWFHGVMLSVRTLRLAQGWIPAQPMVYVCSTPIGTLSVLLPPPRSIS